MGNYLYNLFTFDEPDSIGTKFQLRLFEFFCVIYTLIYSWEWAFYIPKLREVVLTLGLANYIPIDIFFYNNVSVYNAILITACVLYPLLAKKQRWLYMAAFLLFHLQHVARFSQGEIPHSANLIAFSLLGLGLGAIFFKELKKALPFAFGFVLFFGGLGYTSAAISKLVATGPQWIDGSHLWLWIGEKSMDVLSRDGEFSYTFIQEMALNNWWIATFFLFFGLITELSGVFVWWKKTRPYVISALILMHIGIYMSMNIFFTAFTLQLFIMGYEWNKLINKAESAIKTTEKQNRLIEQFVLY